eukprot:gene8225-11131_t
MKLIQLFVIVPNLMEFVWSDALHPVRYDNEDAFFKAKTHERSFSMEEMNEKINVIKKRRSKNFKNDTIIFTNSKVNKYPNILLLLVDDLGYGDLSVPPFTTPIDKYDGEWPCSEGGILSPNLERMAKNGVTMTNFHSASPVCSPSRVAVMTGLYPWRLTAMNAFELGRDLSQRNGFLPQIPTGPEILREAGYYTMHSGKWHLGGMREEMRVDRAYHDKCSRPSPNQHGFEEYISELDGPESPRYTFLMRSILHSKGHRHLLKDDVPIPIIENPHEQNVLSDREVSDVIHFIKESQTNRPNQPWFAQVWFNAPHGPWELLHCGEKLYSDHYNKSHKDWENTRCGKDSLYNMRWHYKTMVSAMDKSVGMLLDSLKALNIEENTLVVFTSDNGPEMGAGTGGMYQEGKRSLMEGGVRVPAIWQWKGKIPANSYTTFFGGNTDLVPTFLDAANVKPPKGMKFDGISLLPVLFKAGPIKSTKDLYEHQYHSKLKPGEKEIKSRYFSNDAVPMKDLLHITEPNGLRKLSDESISSGKNHTRSPFSIGSASGMVSTGLHHSNPIGRVFLWHKDTDPFCCGYDRVQSAGYYEYIKIITTSYRGCIIKVYDMKHDPTERNNLVFNQHKTDCFANLENFDIQKLHGLLPKSIAKDHCNYFVPIINSTSSTNGKPADSVDICIEKYYRSLISKTMIILHKLAPFVKFGNYGHQKYMKEDIDKATCNVPLASQLKTLDYFYGSECKSYKHGCTEPLYSP